MPLSRARDRERKRMDRGAYKQSVCYICSDSRVLDIHHKDGNHQNNTLNNLVPLCPTCHALVTRGKVTLEELKGKSNLNIEGVQPNTGSKKDKLKEVGLIMKGNEIEGVVKPSSLNKGIKPDKPPLYNPQKKYIAGEKVLVKQGKRLIEITVPELDAEGNALPDGATSQCYTLVSNKPFTPAFRPVAKPLSKVKRKKWQ